MKNLLLLPAVLFVVGCATSPLGTDSFACPNADGGGVRCASAKQVYQMTNNSDYVATINELDSKSKPLKVTASEWEGVDPSGNAAYQLPQSDKPVPVRTNAKVIRVKIFPYEDESGDLHAGDYIFTEVEQRKWSIVDSQTARNRKTLTPLIIKNDPLK